jgi:hypothetical protein
MSKNITVGGAAKGEASLNRKEDRELSAERKMSFGEMRDEPSTERVN